MIAINFMQTTVVCQSLVYVYILFGGGKMAQVVLENKPESYEKLGVQQGKVAVWEDGKRDDDRAGSYEWWYFDGIFDDGSKVVMAFNTKGHSDTQKEGAQPLVMINITSPEGKTYRTDLNYSAAEATFATENCDVKIGPHRVSGNIEDYDIHFEPKEGIGADLHLNSTSTPWRPGSGYYNFGNDLYFTWLCVVPTGKLSGTLTYNGKTVTVNGTGYHDHQWGDINTFVTYNNWLWARQNFSDYTILNFDIVTSRDYNYQRLPMTFIQDKKGNLIFENFDPKNVKYEVFEEYEQEDTGKLFPKDSQYTWEKDDIKVQYRLKVTKEIGLEKLYADAPEPVQKQFDALDLYPGYARDAAIGELTITTDGKTIKDSGELIYEFPSVGKEYKPYMVTD